jgi:hypothetical protein
MASMERVRTRGRGEERGRRFPVGDERTGAGRLGREASSAGWLGGLGTARPGGLDTAWRWPARGRRKGHETLASGARAP